MSSTAAAEKSKEAVRYVVERERVEKVEDGFLGFTRRVTETIDCETKEEAESYKVAQGPYVAATIYDLDDVDENGIPHYYHEQLSRPTPDPDKSIRDRLKLINARLVALGYYELETLLFVHPDGTIELSKGQPQYIGTSRRFMWVHLSNYEKVDSEGYRLGVVGEIGLRALKASEENYKLSFAMDFAAQFERLQNNYRIGKTFQRGKNSHVARSRGGHTTGQMKSAKLNETIEIVRELIRHPDVIHHDKQILLEKLKLKILERNDPKLLRKDGKLLSDKTIKKWMDEALHRNDLVAIKGRIFAEIS